MNQAIKTTVSGLGLSAGIAGIEHGIFELLQGNVRPDGLFIESIGPPCQPEAAWNSCEPALTIVPNFLVTGILAIAIGLIMTIWSAGFVQRKYGGVVLIFLSIALLLFGGGLFPPVIGIIAGVFGTRINKPLGWTRTHLTGTSTRWLARLYPWALVAYLVMVLGQWIVGHFFNEFMMSVMCFNVLLFMSFLLLTIPSASVHDALVAKEA
jgi:hypothetical protein